MIAEQLKEMLQNLLGSNYLVVLEEKRDYNFNGNVVVLSEYSGENYSSAFVYNYQASVYTYDVQSTMQELDAFAYDLNNQVFQTSKFPYVKLLVSAPTNITNFQITKNDYTGVISLTIQAIASKGADEVRYIMIDGVDYMVTRCLPSYQAEINNTNINGQKLNSSEIGRASLLIQCNIPAVSNMSVFKKHMFDSTVGKNTTYNLVLVYNDGSQIELNVKIKDIAHSSERGALPLYSVTFAV